jgi:hypothetical protein
VPLPLHQAIVAGELLFLLHRHRLWIKCDNMPYGMSFYFSLKSGFGSRPLSPISKRVTLLALNLDDPGNLSFPTMVSEPD